MRIFIDESGNFMALDGAKSRWSCVAALVLPDESFAALCADYAVLRDRLSDGKEEMKGSQLTEDQIAEVLSLLHRYDAIVEVCAVDMGGHTAADIGRMKDIQADKLFEHITPHHQSSLIASLDTLAQSIRDLPNQLFVQSFLTIILISRLLETATMYYSQRAPHELAEFHWVIDAKSSEITASERVWIELILPTLKTRSETEPMEMLENGDYSHFQRFVAPDRSDNVAANISPVDLNQLLQESFLFADSTKVVGLQLSDIVVSAVSRALNNSLQQKGWDGLGNLLVRRTSQTLRLISLSPDPPPSPTASLTNVHVHRVLAILESRAKSMFV